MLNFIESYLDISFNFPSTSLFDPIPNVFYVGRWKVPISFSFDVKSVYFREMAFRLGQIHLW